MLDRQESRINDEIDVLLAYAKGAKKRRRILQTLQLAPKNCNQVAQELESDWWTIQKHLQFLMKATLINSVNFGRIRFYKITPKGEFALISTSKLKNNNLVKVRLKRESRILEPL